MERKSIPSFDEYKKQCQEDPMLSRPLKLIAASAADEDEREEKMDSFFREKYDMFLARAESKRKAEKKKELGAFSSPPKQQQIHQFKSKLASKPKVIKQVEGQTKLENIVSKLRDREKTEREEEEERDKDAKKHKTDD